MPDFEMEEFMSYYRINFIFSMDATLIRNGYNVERRKMYIENRINDIIQQGIIYEVV